MNGRMNEAYGAFAYAYDEPLGQTFLAAVAPLIDAVLSRYRLRRRSHLDLACGTALAMQHFARRGFVSTGIDASLPMLSVARGRSGRLIAGDLRALPLRGAWGLITCLYDSLNHLLRKRDLVQAFQSARKAMDRESLFLFDMNQPEVYRRVWTIPEPFQASGNGYELSIHTRYSRWTGLGTGNVTGWTVHGGRRYPIEEVRRQRAYSKATILEALRSSGLQAGEVIDFDPFPQHSSTPSRAKWLFVVRAA